MTDTGWRAMDSAPKDGKDILIFNGGCCRVAFWDTARGGLWSIWPGREPARPTHWQPLPKPPETEE